MADKKKLVTYAQLNTLAKGIYNKLHTEVGTAAAGVLQNKNDIAALSDRMTTAEGKLDVINGNETTEGSIAKALKDAKDYADQQDGTLHTTITGEVNGVKAELQGNIDKKADAKAMEDALKEKVDQSAYNTKVGELEAADTALDGRLDVIEGEGEGSIKKALADAKADAAANYATKGTVSALDGRVGTAEDDIDKIEVALGKDAQGNIKSVDTRIQEAVSGVTSGALKDAQDDITDLKGRMTTAEGKITAVEGKAAANESAIEAINNADTGILKQAKNYADTKITDLVNGAPEAMDTLQELAKAITDHQTVYDAYVQTVSTNLAKKVDATIYEGKVKELENADTALGNRATALETIVGKEAEGDQEASGLVKKVADNAAGIATNKTEIANLKKAVGDVSEVAAKSALDAVSGRVTTVEGKVTNLETAVGTPAVDGGAAATGLYKVIADEATRAQGIEAGLRTDVDALKNTVGNDAKGLVKDVDDLQAAVANLQTSNHTHANKEELDKFAAGDKDKLDNAVAKVTGGAEVAGSIAEAKKAADDAQTAADGAKALANGLKLAVVQGVDDAAVVTIKLQNKDGQDQSTIDLPYEFVADSEIQAIIDGLGTQA